MLQLSICMMAWLGTFAPSRASGSRDHSSLRLVLPMIPLVGALFIACSRIVDYRHNFDDVLAGAIIGFSAAIVAFNYYHHPVFTSQSGSPRDRRWKKSTLR